MDSHQKLIQLNKTILTFLFFFSSFLTMSQVTFDQATEFMKQRCKNIEHEYVNGVAVKMTVNNELEVAYFFLTKTIVNEEEYYCIMLVNQYMLQVLNAKCGKSEKKKEFYDFTRLNRGLGTIVSSN